MKPEFFREQIMRMVGHFEKGPMVFSKERTKMIWDQCRDLPDQNFKKVVDFMIGDFHPSYPPKLSNFIEQAALQRKKLFEEQTAQAAKNWIENQTTRERSSEGLKSALAKAGATSLVEAILKQRKVSQ